jgi:large subunit ribosomal protein L10
MKSRDEKKQDVEKLKELLGQSSSMFITGFEKITVQQDFELRKAVRGAGGNYRVVKNNLVEKAAEGTPNAEALGGLAGMNSLAYTADDPVALAKALTTYAKKYATFTFKAGVVDGRVIDAGEIKQLSEMPSRDELFAKLLFLINAPSTYLARAISGVGRNVAVVVDQGCKQDKFSS